MSDHDDRSAGHLGERGEPGQPGSGRTGGEGGAGGAGGAGEESGGPGGPGGPGGAVDGGIGLRQEVRATWWAKASVLAKIWYLLGSTGGVTFLIWRIGQDL